MRVLLVKPGSQWLARIVGPDIGLGYLATQIRNTGHTVKILDCLKEKIDPKGIKKEIQEYQPEVVGFKSYTMDLPWVKEASLAVKAINPRIVTLVGGPHPSGDPGHTLRYLKEIDFAFRGEAEVGLPMLLHSISHNSSPKLEEVPSLCYRVGEEIEEIKVNKQSFVQDLDTIGMPAWDLIDPRGYRNFTRAWGNGGAYIPISFTRGCPFNCTFCATRLINGNGFRKRGIGHILAELNLLYHEYGVRNLSIADDNLTLDKNYLMEVCRAINEAKLSFRWDFPNGVRVTTLDEELLHRLETTGWGSICVAIESGSQRILDHMGKKITLKEIRDGVHLIKKTTKMEILGFFILGYPEETLEDIRATIKFALDLPLDMVTFFYFSPHPGTEIHRQLVEKYPEKFDNIDWTTFQYVRPTFPPPNMSGEQFERLVRGAYLRFYLRPRVILRILRRRRYQQTKLATIIIRFIKRMWYLFFER